MAQQTGVASEVSVCPYMLQSAWPAADSNKHHVPPQLWQDFQAITNTALSGLSTQRCITLSILSICQ